MLHKIFTLLFFLLLLTGLRAQVFEHDPRFGVKAAYGYYDKWNYVGVALLYDNLQHIPDTGAHHLIIGSRVICAGVEFRISDRGPMMTTYVGAEGHLAAFLIEARAMRFTNYKDVTYCADLGAGFSVAGWAYITGGFLIPLAGVDPLGVAGPRIAAGVNIPLVKLKKRS